jgi:hypothetical protein
MGGGNVSTELHIPTELTNERFGFIHQSIRIFLIIALFKSNEAMI